MSIQPKIAGKRALERPGALRELDDAERRVIAEEVSTQLGAPFVPASALVGEQRLPGVRHEVLGISFVLVPAGTFDMGLGERDLATYRGYFTEEVRARLDPLELRELELVEAAITQMGPSSSPVRTVTVAPFAMAETQLSRETIAAMSGQPADDWTFASPREARTLLTAHGFRLPNEAEWEYVARQDRGATFLFDAVADYLGSIASGSRSSTDSSFGVGQLNGEWVEDPWHDTYEGAPLDGSPFRLATDAHDGPGVCRGDGLPCGQYLSGAAGLFVAYRFREGALRESYWGARGRGARPAFGPDAEGRWRLRP